SVVRPRTLRRKLTSLAVVALVGTGVFAGVSVLLSSAYEPLPPAATNVAMEAPVPVLELPSSPAIAPLAALVTDQAPVQVAAAPTVEPVVDTSAVLVINRPGSTLQRRAFARPALPAKNSVAKKPAKAKAP